MLKVMMPGAGGPPKGAGAPPVPPEVAAKLAGDEDVPPPAPDEPTPDGDEEPDGDEGPPKIPQPLVVYMDGSKGPFECQRCCYFIQPNACEAVDGDIDPKGCCNIFCPEDHDEPPIEEAQEALVEAPSDEQVQ